MEKPMSLPEFSRVIKRSDNFTRNAIRLGMFNAMKVGNYWVLDGAEAEAFNRNPFKITRERLGVK